MFGLNGSRASYGAIIDVGSGSVGVGIVSSDKDKKLPEIIFSHREYMRPGGSGDGEEMLRKMREALFAACLKLSDQGLKKLSQFDSNARIRKTLVTCSSPWAYTITKDVRYSDDKNFKITRTLIDELVREAEKQAEKVLNEGDISRNLGLEVIERTIVDTHVNGYHIDDVIGKNGKELSMTHVVGLIPKDILDAVEEVEEKIFQGTKMNAHTFMLVIHCVLREIFPKSKNMLIVDVTGESTEIGVVEHGKLTHTEHTMYGSNTLIRSILKDTNGNADDTISRLNILTEDLNDPKKINEFDGLMHEFDTVLIETLRNLEKIAPLPSTIVITALPELSNIFVERIPYAIDKEFGRSSTVLEMHEYMLKELAEKDNLDSFISIGARFFHKLHGCGELEAE